MIKLLNDDCLKVMAQLKDESIDLIVTDPPYGMMFVSDRRKEKYKKIDNDDNLDWLDDYFSNCQRILKNDTAIYSFCSWHNIDKFKQSFEKYFKLKNIIIWEKNNTSMGDLTGQYAPKYEMILYGHKGRCELNEFRYPDVIKVSKTGNVHHPTEKPTDLLEIFIRNSSKEGNVVFDGFMGSGSTGVACVRTDRNFIGIELDKHYFDIATDRINNTQTKLF